MLLREPLNRNATQEYKIPEQTYNLLIAGDYVDWKFTQNEIQYFLFSVHREWVALDIILVNVTNEERS